MRQSFHVTQGTYIHAGVVNRFPTLTTYLLPCRQKKARYDKRFGLRGMAHQE